MNGCGPKWIKKAIVEYKACAWHDEMYSIGGTELERWNTDFTFLKMMLKERPCLFAIAFVYYILVVVLGPIYFNYK